MKLHHLTQFVILSLSLAIAHAQERVATLDAAAARARLSGNVAKTPGTLTAKGGGGDPITKRFYTKDAVVMWRVSGAREEHPYVAVPLLFQVNSGELFDATSRENLVKVAQMLKELGPTGASFAIEGHASAEGEPQRNKELSNRRAAKIQSLLREQGVPAGELVRVEGFGSDHAQFPATAQKPQLQQDRRVLVVKEK